MVGLHVHRIECDELWAYVGHKRNPQKGGKRHPSPVFGDQYTYVALASATRAIIGYRTGKRNEATTDDFIQDLRQRVIGSPEISTDGLHFYKPAIRDAFGKRRYPWRDPKDLFGNAPERNRSVPPLFPGPGSSSRA